MPEQKKKVFVVWDALYERVVSVHVTEAGASKRIQDENEKRATEKQEDYCFDFMYNEFELED